MCDNTAGENIYGCVTTLRSSGTDKCVECAENFYIDNNGQCK